MKKGIIIGTIIFISYIIFSVYMIFFSNLVEVKYYYTNEDFGIEEYKSLVDKDNDGIDDQTDILQNVREYINTKPKYKSEYYNTGYPKGEYGVCTDVVALGMLNAGYDLMDLVNKDIISYPERYNIEKVDKNIDFRRVRNLKVYLDNHAIVLTTDIHSIEEWHGGDIIVFKNHIGIISDKRNKNGVPFVIHHANPLQINYEEDFLENRDDIVGHYRIS